MDIYKVENNDMKYWGSVNYYLQTFYLIYES